MKTKTKEKYMVILPIHDEVFKQSVEYTFGNVLFLDDTNDYKKNEQLIEKINESDADQIILFDYLQSYRHILPCIDDKKVVKWIFTHSISSLTDRDIFSIFNTIIEFYDREIVKVIGVTDQDLYELLSKEGYNVKFIIMDNVQSNIAKKKETRNIGLLGVDFDPNNNFYNQLSALTMVNYNKVKLIIKNKATDPFLKMFNIKYIEGKNVDNIIPHNYVNLYVNFTNNYNEIILKSMDNGVPCILGNTSLFDNYPILRENLILRSDDDVNELVEKINHVKDKEKEIFREYSKFRKNYTLQSKKLVQEFLK